MSSSQILLASGFPPISFSANYLVVAGGGSGSANGAGGGGGGGVRSGTRTLNSGITYTITVGAGGAGISGYVDGNPGNASSITATGFTTISCTGGGEGKHYSNGGSGGSGGGGGYGSTGYSSAVSGEGYPGGYAAIQYIGSGGGGAGGYGTNAYGSPWPNNTGVPGNGGNGVQSSITGTAVYYAGGGGGANSIFDIFGSHGLGSGTNSGGGSTAGTSGSSSGDSGIIVISVPDSVRVASTTGSPTVTTSGGNRIYKFTGTGTIKW